MAERRDKETKERKEEKEERERKTEEVALERSLACGAIALVLPFSLVI